MSEVLNANLNRDLTALRAHVPHDWSSARKNQILLRLARDLAAAEAAILAANARDLAALPATTTNAYRDRLHLTPARLAAMTESLRQVAALPDPVGEVVEARVLDNDLRVRRVRAPLGVILMIFESRPNVALEAFSLAFKAGNAIILRGGRESAHTVNELYRVMRAAFGDDTPPFYGVTDYDRAIVSQLLHRPDLIDVVVPRGGEKLIAFVGATARMPIIKNDRGLCHAFVDEGADLNMATAIVINGKTQRPGVCNALETVLVHRTEAARVLPMIFAHPAAAALEWRVDQAAAEVLGPHPRVRSAADDDWDTEHLDLILNCRVVDGLDQALAHIARHGSRHSETIITGSEPNARRFSIPGRRGRGVLERLDAFYRRLRAGPRRRVGHQHPKVARARPGGTARTDHAALVDRRRGPGASLASRSDTVLRRCNRPGSRRRIFHHPPRIAVTLNESTSPPESVMKRIQPYVIPAALVGALVLAFQNCSRAGFGNDAATFDSLSSKYAAPPICDPLGGKNAGAALSNEHGLVGKLIYENAANQVGLGTPTTFAELVKRGTVAPATLYMSLINVPTRSFTEGFSSAGAAPLVDDSTGEKLIEWFGIDMVSVLRLGAGDVAGYYQFATITDDGSLLSATLGQTESTLVNNDGLHPTAAKCSDVAVLMNASTALPIHYRYLQGPRTNIASMIAWRKVSGPKPPEDDCAQAAASSGGWTIIPAQNYFLPADAPVNPCH